MVWGCFVLYTVILRAVLPSNWFLRATLRDKHSHKHRRPAWAATLHGPVRMRVLWGFRGLAYAVIPWALKHNPGLPSALECVLWYLYLAVFISFLFEGLGAFFFAVHEAQRGCQLALPFQRITSLCFRAAYNAYLQPLGTAVNVVFYVINREYRQRLVLNEIWGPLVDGQGHCRAGLLSGLCARAHPPPSDAVIAERLAEWLATFRRKRAAVGLAADRHTVAPRPAAAAAAEDPPAVFAGSLFPELEEWLYMRDHCTDYLPLEPWERFGSKVDAAEKFLRWFPTHAAQVVRLLRAPYNFDAHREVLACPVSHICMLRSSAGAPTGELALLRGNGMTDVALYWHMLPS